MKTFLEVSSLHEAQMTGIPETVCGLAECALNEADADNMRFVVGASEVHRDIVAKVVEARDGTVMNAYLAGGFSSPLRVDPDDWNAGIYCHRVSMHRVFDRQAMVLYDLTPLTCPQYHSADTIHNFNTNFTREVSSVDHVVTISDAVYQDFVGYFPEYTHKTSSSLCGLPYGALTVPDIDLPSSLTNKPYFVSVGTLEPRKNNVLIFEMLSRYPELLSTHRFVFIGKRGWGDDIETLVEAMGLKSALQAGQIIFTGFVNEDVKRKLIAGSVALIYPSHYEGFGLPLIEALALGKAVICRPGTSIPQVTGDHAFYIKRSEPDALRTAIAQVLANPQAIADQAANYIEWAKRFQWESIWSLLKNSIAPPEQAQ